MSPKRIALWFLIGSVGASALLGIIIVLAGTFSDIEVRIILTTLTISAMSICALGAGALWESGRNRLLSLSGILLAVAAALLFLIGIWTKTSEIGFWKFSGSLGLVAVATAHACLISLAKLSSSFAWARIAAFIAVYALAGEIIFIIYGEPKQSDTIMRVIGATSIIVAALTIVIPVFHRLSRGESAADAPLTQGRVLISQITCPECGSQQQNTAGEMECDNCGCRFTITILKTGKASPPG